MGGSEHMREVSLNRSRFRRYHSIRMFARGIARLVKATKTEKLKYETEGVARVGRCIGRMRSYGVWRKSPGFSERRDVERE
ncbi:hypothetical protein AX768_02190 [Burkholderia sp. PAMC 28687]|nr:hypothetical protein AX768_02190 [Burkholderia sp. PAMC 28687]